MEPTQPKSLFLAAFLRKGAFGTVKAITTEDTEDTEEKHRFAVLDFVGESRKGVPDFLRPLELTMAGRLRRYN
jgi:hypothetical protein